MRQGDQVHLQVNAAYETGRGKVQGLEGIATQVAGAASRSAAGLESTGAASGTNALAAGGALTTGKQQGVPPAYLNYLVYDTDFQLVDQGFVQISEDAATQVGSRSADGEGETLALDVDIAQNGFLYAYLSHEAEGNSSSATAVYFDDFTVEHEGISIVQHNDYYAFGAVYQQSADRVLNNAYLYQGKELQDGLGLDLYDFHARQYDPLLGRMNSVDPMAASFDGMSPYAGMGNNPVSYVDPDGQAIGLAGALIGGAVLGGGAGYLYGKSQGYSGRQMFNAIAGGALLGVGVAAGVQTGFFGQVGQGIGNVAGQGLSNGINLAHSVFQGVGPTVGMDVATQAASNIIAGPITQPGVLVDDYGLTHLDYGPSYQPSRYAGMNIMQYHQAKVGDAFFEHPITQGAFELATLPLPFPKFGLGKMLGRGASKYVNLASRARTKHILSGDLTGGGHAWFGSLKSFMNGVTRSKSMFPSTWSNSKIMHGISEVVTSNPWVQQTGRAGQQFTRTGNPVRFKTEGYYRGLKIRVIHTGDDIITAFPVR